MIEIDVTKCENYKLGFSGYICAYPNLRNDCSLNNNCKFKQLHRYKQVINEIKNMVEVIIETNKVYPLQNNLSKIIQKCEEVDNKH